MEIKPFTFSRVPEIYFGAGSFKKIDKLISPYGHNVLLVTGGASFRKSSNYHSLLDKLSKQGIQMSNLKVTAEPSPDLVDIAVNKYRQENIGLVVAIGGGSVIDAGKAISAMLPLQESVMEYLEGVGSGKTHCGNKIPFMAIPTTSGTGSEASKNAVLSKVSEKGFKKSLRHNNFIPDIALIDPELIISCPADITAASGLDTFSQLLEAYTSTNTSVMTDSLIYDGLKYAVNSLIPAATDQADNLNVRSAMAYAAMISGIALANSGLGIIHGLASPIGGYFTIPHGVVCGTLLAEANKMNINLMLEDKKMYLSALKKYARIGALFCSNREIIESDLNNISNNCLLLVKKLEKWLEVLKIPSLGRYGIKENDLDKIVKKAANKNNPITLKEQQIREILLNRL